MIKLTGLNNKEFYLNCDLIEKIEVTPDTVITTTTNKKYVVIEDPQTIIQRIIQFKIAYMSTRPEVIK
ncbi:MULTISPECIES: flagellar FlbD family protein [Caloramator]|uniref:Flagellar protein FlbD n=1 Tax=Caloramator proteoclasticus DSM 10124 TaxID=1121262 RepID=A0A1M4STX4_9CLOT|nr:MULTISPECIES: flagellar FlbD family protein [Caloramator]SHE35467.1 flagellar protein FlbD [Caloramator proteoclasticus DSM 10124]